jgi:polysaccharide transporter, PST family
LLSNSIFKKLFFGTKNREVRDILKNGSWLFLDKILRQGLNFVLTAYIARYLGVELFGLWSYALAFVVIFSFFSTLGIYNQLLRDFVRYPEKQNELLGNAFIIKLLGACVAFVLSYATIVITKPEQPLLHNIISLIAIGYIIQSFDVIDFFFQSQLKAKWIAISRFVSFLIFASLKLYLVHAEFPLLSFIWAQLGELLFSASIMAFFFNRYYQSIFKWKINWSGMSLMLKESLPILFAEIAILIYMRIDQVMIGEMMGNGAVGIFSAAVRLSELWYLVPGVICSTLFPTIIKAYYEGGAGYQKKLQRLYDLLVWLSIGIAITISIIAPYIVDIIYGDQFRSASSILVIHIWTSVFVFIGFASNQQLVLENLGKFSFYRTLFGVLANVSFNFILIPIWGAMGAAYATLAALAFSWLSSYFFKETRPIFWMNINSLNFKRLIKEYVFDIAK